MIGNELLIDTKKLIMSVNFANKITKIQTLNFYLANFYESKDWSNSSKERSDQMNYFLACYR